MPEETIAMQMKAITIHQPWASLIASGAKRYETRGWKTNHRGRLAIHAGKEWSKDHERAWNRLRRSPYTIPEVAPLGAIICVCDLVDCIPVEQIRDQLSPLERELGDYSDGRYAWELKVVKVAPAPIPMAGKQGLWTWEYDMPKPKPKAFLDTETTGLDENARICEIAIVDEHGEILLNTVVNPQIPIPTIASSIHSITDAVVKNAPTFAQLQAQIVEIFERYDVHIYNAEYDTRLLAQSGEGIAELKATCVMKPFARIYGQWDDHHRSYTYQSLGKACEFYDIRNPHPHRALGDAESARLVWLAMTKKAVR